MEYKLVPVLPGPEEINITIPRELIVLNQEQRLKSFLLKKKVSEGKNGILMINGTQVKNSNYNQIIEYLLNQSKNKPRGYTLLIKKVKIPAKLLV